MIGASLGVLARLQPIAANAPCARCRAGWRMIHAAVSLTPGLRPRGRVVMQRPAKAWTSVRFRPRPPVSSAISHSGFAAEGISVAAVGAKKWGGALATVAPIAKEAPRAPRSEAIPR